eukprot:s251_g2.t1
MSLPVRRFAIAPWEGELQPVLPCIHTASPKADAVSSDPKLQDFRKKQEEILRKAKAEAISSEKDKDEVLEVANIIKYWKHWTPLYAAASRNRPRAAALLLRARADVHEGKYRSKDTPLHLVSPDMVAVLLQAGADPNKKDDYGKTSLSVAIAKEQWKLAVALLENGQSGQLCNLDLNTMCILIRAEGPGAVQCFEKIPQRAMLYDSRVEKPVVMERAHLGEQQLRVILAKGRKHCKDLVFVNSEGKLAEYEYAKLSSLNLFHQREMPASLKYLPGLWASDACNRKLLEALVNTTNEDIFKTQAVSALVQAAWMQTRFSTVCEVFSSLLLLPLLCHVSFTLRNEPHFVAPLSLWILLCMHAKKSFEELSQYVVMYRYSQYGFTVLEFDNVADIAYIMVGWVAIVRQALDPTKLEKPWMSTFSAMVWLRALYSLRGETWMGPRVLPILWALKDTLAFFLVTWTGILAATHAYYNLQMREEPSPAYAALMQVVRLGIFGDFDLFEFEGLDTRYKSNREEWEPVDPDPGPNYVEAHILFYSTGVGITIMLMNLLVGVLSQNFDRYQDQSEVLFLRARAKMILELQARPWKLKYILQWLLRDEEKNPLHASEDPEEEKKSVKMSEDPEEEKKSVKMPEDPEEPSNAAAIAYFLCFAPLIPYIVCLKKKFLLRGIEKRWRNESVVLVLCSPMLFILSTCFAVILLFCRFVFQMQLTAIFYMVAVAFDCCGEYGNTSPEESHIGLVIPADPNLDELGSFRSEMKTRLEELQSEQKSLRDEQRTLTELVKELVEPKGREPRKSQVLY